MSDLLERLRERRKRGLDGAPRVTMHSLEGGEIQHRYPLSEAWVRAVLAAQYDALVALAALVKQREHFGCPQCDGSGAYPDADGGAVQCQACDEYEQARAALEKVLEE